jgi:hypothetical protein
VEEGGSHLQRSQTGDLELARQAYLKAKNLYKRMNIPVYTKKFEERLELLDEKLTR